MPKIAFALERFSQYAGGAESYAVGLADSLIKKGWEVHFFGCLWDGKPDGAIFHPIRLWRFLPSWCQMLQFAHEHKKMVLEQGNFDIVLGFGNTVTMNVYQSHGGVHAYSTKRKTYYLRNSIQRFLKQLFAFFSIKYWVRNWIESAPFRMVPAPRIVAISQMVVDDFQRCFGMEQGVIDLVYNGIDTNRHNLQNRRQKRGALRQEWGLNDGGTAFLFMSYTLRKKGLLVLIEAAAKLREEGNDFKVIVVGGLPDSGIKKHMEKLNVTDVFFFCGPSKEPELYFANSDVFVLPTYYDTCSLVVFEAMSNGLPVITTSANGASGIINGMVNGLVISHPPSVVDLAKAMSCFLDKEKCLDMSRAAAETGQLYSSVANHQKMIHIFEEVLEAQKQ